MCYFISCLKKVIWLCNLCFWKCITPNTVYKWYCIKVSYSLQRLQTSSFEPLWTLTAESHHRQDSIQSSQTTYEHKLTISKQLAKALPDFYNSPYKQHWHGQRLNDCRPQNIWAVGLLCSGWFLVLSVHTKNDNYKDNDISIHTSRRYHLYILSAHTSVSL